MHLIATLLQFFVTVASHADPVIVQGLTAEPPAEWVAEKPANRLRSHQFRLKSQNDRLADAEIIISPGMKPDPEKVFPGLKAQFVVPEGKTIDDIARTSKIEIPNATIHLLDISGTWNYKERPFDPKSKVEQRDDWRAIWAIVVVGDEASHVRLSGPRSVVDQYATGFEKWLKELKKP